MNKEKDGEDDVDIQNVLSSGVDRLWSISVTINSAYPITKLFSSSHEIDIIESTANKSVLTLN